MLSGPSAAQTHSLGSSQGEQQDPALKYRVWESSSAPARVGLDAAAMCPRNTPGEALIQPASPPLQCSQPALDSSPPGAGAGGAHTAHGRCCTALSNPLICRGGSEISEHCRSRAIPWQWQLSLAGSVPGAGRAEGAVLPWAQLALGVGCDRGHVCHLVTVPGAWDSEEALLWVSFT